MELKYEKKDEMTFIGFYKNIREEDGFTECPKFWDEEYAKKYSRLWATMKPETKEEEALLENGIGMFGLCVSEKDSFQYWIAGLYKGGEVPPAFRLITVRPSLWARFTEKGPIAPTLQKLNAYVYGEWAEGEGKLHKMDRTIGIEEYSVGDPASSDYKFGIWVPVEK